MNYNQLNRHERDERLHFDAREHVYTIDGQVFRSVTTIVEDQFEKFDADYWAEKKALDLGLTPDEIKAQWAHKGEIARTLGTQMHEKIERYYLGLPSSPPPQGGRLRAGEPSPSGELEGGQGGLDETYQLFLRFTRQYHLTPYRTEWAIFDEDSRVAGTLDFLDLQDGVFTIYDWKRSNKILYQGQPDTVSRFGKTALQPIGHIPDTTYWHYALQVSIYRYILEKNYHIRTAAGRLAIFHPDYGRPHVVEVPYLREEAIAVLQHRK